MNKEIIEASRIGTMKVIKSFALTFIIVMGILIGGISAYNWLQQNHSEYKICVYVQENKICDYTQPDLKCNYFGKKDYILNCFRAVDKESSGVAGAVAYYMTDTMEISNRTYCNSGHYGCVLHDQTDYTSHGLEFGSEQLNKSIERCGVLFCDG